MDDRIKITCSRCNTPFREKWRFIINGYQAQCPNCMRMLTFDSDSQDQGIRRAMTEARRRRTGYAPPPAEPVERY